MKITPEQIKAACPWMAQESSAGSLEYAKYCVGLFDEMFAPIKHEVFTDPSGWSYAQPVGGFTDEP